MRGLQKNDQEVGLKQAKEIPFPRTCISTGELGVTDQRYRFKKV